MNESRTIFRRLMQLMLIASLVLSGGSVAAQSATPDASPVTSPVAGNPLERSVSYLQSQQADDGGFPGFEGTSDAGVTTDAVVALAAAEAAGVDTGSTIADALTFLETEGLTYAETGPGQRAKLILAVIAAGDDPTSFAGQDLVEPLFASKSETGVYGSGLFDHALVTLAAAAVGSDQTAALAGIFASYQTPDGSWAFDTTTTAGAGDTNTTALVVQALVAADMADSPPIEPALAYLGMAQVPGGGFAYQPADPLVPDANSTALAVQALIATNADLTNESVSAAIDALAAFQNPSGGFRYTNDVPEDNLFATVQAIPALAGYALPVVTEGGAATPVASPQAEAA